MDAESAPGHPRPGGANTALVAAYRAIACDLDGVVYRGERAVPHAVEALTEAREHARVAYVTNNASRTPEAVADQLRRLGLPAEPDDVCTSAQAGAWLLADHVPVGSPVLAVGGPGVAAALVEAGLRPVADEGALAVLQGWGADVRVADLAAAAVAIHGGARWVATNTDRTLPTARGIVPGNGTLVDAVRTATGRDPEVVGKPYPPLYQRVCRRLELAPDRVLAVGDRLDTDVAGAHAAGMDSLWVLTGVHRLTDLAASPATPTYAAADLSALHRPPVFVQRSGWRWWAEQTCLEADSATGHVVVRCGAADRHTLAAIAARAIVELREDQQVPRSSVATAAAALDSTLGLRSAGPPPSPLEPPPSRSAST